MTKPSPVACTHLHWTTTVSLNLSARVWMRWFVMVFQTIVSCNKAILSTWTFPHTWTDFMAIWMRPSLWANQMLHRSIWCTPHMLVWWLELRWWSQMSCTNTSVMRLSSVRRRVTARWFAPTRVMVWVSCFTPHRLSATTAITRLRLSWR